MRISDWSSDVCSSDLQVDVLQFVFLGPLVGALSRAGTGWVSDKWGGARVTFWVFVLMMLGVFGVMYFIQAASWWGFLSMFIFMFRSEEHTSELQSLMRISYAVFCLKKKNTHPQHHDVFHKLTINNI